MISQPGLPSPRLWIDSEVPPEIFGSTKYRKAIDDGHEDAEAQRPLARDDHARHLLVIGVPWLFDVALVDGR